LFVPKYASIKSYIQLYAVVFLQYAPRTSRLFWACISFLFWVPFSYHCTRPLVNSYVFSTTPVHIIVSTHRIYVKSATETQWNPHKNRKELETA